MNATPRRDWRTPALILAAGAATMAISLGVRHAFGLFLAPMSRDNGWTREVFSFAIAVQNLAWGAAQPFAGRLADRHGAGRARRAWPPAPSCSAARPRSPGTRWSRRTAPRRPA